MLAQVSGFGFGFRVSGFEFRVSGFEFHVSGSGFRVPGFGFQVSGLGFRIMNDLSAVLAHGAVLFHERVIAVLWPRPHVHLCQPSQLKTPQL